MSHRLVPADLVRAARSFRKSSAITFLLGAFACLILAWNAPILAGDKDKKEGTPEVDPAKEERFLLFLDKFGNPQGGDLGLAKENEFKGKKILVWGHLEGEHRYVFIEANPMWTALRKRGFEVQLRDKEFPAEELPKFDQFWLIAYDDQNLKDADVKAMEKFLAAGKGIYLIADNVPYIAQVNELAGRWFDSKLAGDYMGTKIGFVKERKLKDSVLKKFNGEYPIDDHPLLTGVNFVYEGITISHFSDTPKLKVALRASDGKALVGVSTVFGKRVIVDCGFTRYFFDESAPDGSMSFITRTAGTIRFGENVAAFLMGKEKR